LDPWAAKVRSEPMMHTSCFAADVGSHEPVKSLQGPLKFGTRFMAAKRRATRSQNRRVKHQGLQYLRRAPRNEQSGGWYPDKIPILQSWRTLPDP